MPPFEFLLGDRFLNHVVDAFPIIKKRYGANGQPCLTPLLINFFDDWSLMLTFALSSQKSSLVINLGCIPTVANA